MSEAKTSVVADAFEQAVSRVLDVAVSTVLLRMRLEQLELEKEISALEPKTLPSPSRRGTRVSRPVARSTVNGKVAATVVATKHKDPFTELTSDVM